MSNLIILCQIKHVAAKQIQEIPIMPVTVLCNCRVSAVMISNGILIYVKKPFLNFTTSFLIFLQIFWYYLVLLIFCHFFLFKSPWFYKLFLKCISLFFIQLITPVFVCRNYDHTIQFEFNIIKVDFCTLTNIHKLILKPYICLFENFNTQVIRSSTGIMRKLPYFFYQSFWLEGLYFSNFCSRSSTT